MLSSLLEPLPAPVAGATNIAICGPKIGVLREIEHPECALARWVREIPARIVAHLAELDREEIDDIDAEIPVAGCAVHLAAYLGAAGYPAAAAVALAEDISGLVGVAASIRNEGLAKVRLEWIETDACRRFHCDAVSTRLLSTYVGRGTQWRLASAPEDEIEEIATGDVLILKGRNLLPDAPVLHRSPPIGGTGEYRLLLVVDACAFGSADPCE